MIATAVLAGTLAVGLLAAPAQAALRHIDGTVVSKNPDNRTFRISTQSGNVRIKVNAATEFERIASFGALRKGLRVEVDARTTSNGLVAVQIEPQGGGGGDDSGGDDHGGGGGGADDGPNHT
jgi:nitrous oxidase accessory protein NosD